MQSYRCHVVLFDKIFGAQMELFLSERYNSFRRVRQPLYEATFASIQDRFQLRGATVAMSQIARLPS